MCMDPSFRGLAAPVPKSAKPPKFPVKIVLLVFGVLIFTMIAYVMITTYLAGNSAYAPLELGLRMDTLARLAKDSVPSVKDSNFSKVNSEISNMFASDNGEIQRLIPRGRNDPTSKQYRNAERDRARKLRDELNTAKINGVFDAKYKTVLREEIVSVQKAAKRLSRTAGKDFKAALTTFVEHADTALLRLDRL